MSWKLEMNNKRRETDEIDLIALGRELLHHWWLIMIVTIVCGAASFAYSTFIVTPIYESSTKIYILNKQNADTLTLNDTQLSTQLTQDYGQLVTSRTVLESIIQDFHLKTSYGALAKKIKVTNEKDTRIISIAVDDESPLMAKKLANGIRDEAAKHIQKVMNVEAVNVVDEANFPTAPISPNIMKWLQMGLLFGFVLSSFIITLRFLLDDSIKTSEDIEKYLGLSTLAVVPLGNKRQKTGKKAKHRKSRS